LTLNTNSYVNPVYAGSFPDPFVLKYGGLFYGYCTGLRPDGRCFGVLRSPDLVNWEEMAGAMAPLPGGHTMYWAPEVLYHNGLFYMYYSVGNETFMQIRVAVAAQPGGPFEDSRRSLTTQQFAIDAHVFKDDDGALYLFYATDFLEHPRVGTGTVIDRLLDPFTPEGKPRPVTRARYDWQIYDPNRAEKGGVRWHTIEGSFALKHHHKYYQMFSGGNWTNPSYGVSYATTVRLDRPDEWDQAADGENVLPVLRTIPGQVIGPGHNSVVRGPDNRQLYCVYHRWAEDGSVRQMAIDPLDWAGERLIVLGPSYGPQPFPTMPVIQGSGDFENEKAGAKWSVSRGNWQVRDNILYQDGPDEMAQAALALDYRYFLLEIELKALQAKPGRYGFSLNRGETGLFSFFIEPEMTQARVNWSGEGNSTGEKILSLPGGFNPEGFHLVRLEAQGRRLALSLDGVPVQPGPFTLAGEAASLGLVCQSSPAAFAGFALTPGFEVSFPLQDDALASDWQPETILAAGPTDPQSLSAPPAIFSYGDALENYELVMNILLEAGPPENTVFYPAWSRQPGDPRFSFSQEAGGWTLQTGRDQKFSLPAGFDPKIYQQFRFRKTGPRLAVSWESRLLGEIEITPGPARVGLLNLTGKIIEMVRVTAL
jgi:GH43 family beta-xylosidase